MPEQKGNNLKGFKDFYLQDKAKRVVPARLPSGGLALARLPSAGEVPARQSPLESGGVIPAWQSGGVVPARSEVEG